MPSIKISDFKGVVPRASEKLIPEDFAQTANNCDLIRGKITAVKDFESEAQTGNLITAPVKIYKFEDTWCSWDVDTDIVRSLLGTDTPRIYTSDGTDYPKQSSIRMTNMRGAFFWMGAATPTGSPFEATAYIYLTVDGVGLLPLPDPDETVLTVPILVGDTANETATKIATAIQAAAPFVTATPAGPVITVTNASAGYCTPPISSDCGFIVKTTILGTPAVAQVCTITIPAGPNPTSGAGYPRLTWRLGVPAPDVALALTLAGEGDGYVIKSTNWVYTYVTAWGEESKPSPATETVDIEGIQEKTQVTCEAVDMLTGGEYFTFVIDPITGPTSYYCWYTIDGSGTDPAPGGTGAKVELLGLDNPDQIADKIVVVIDAIVGCSAVSDGPLITITNDENGSVTDSADGVGALATGFEVLKTQEGTASLPEITTVDTSRLIHGSHFKLYSTEDMYYVWYQIAATPALIVDFDGEAIASGDWFYFYLMYSIPSAVWPGYEYVERKIVVYFAETASIIWTNSNANTFTTGDLVLSVQPGSSDLGYFTYECLVAAPSTFLPPGYDRTEWELEPGKPTVDDAFKIYRCGYDPAAMDAADHAADFHELVLDKLADVATSALDVTGALSTVTVTGLFPGETSDPDNGALDPELTFFQPTGVLFLMT